MEEFLDTYYNHKQLMEILRTELWGKTFDRLNRKYEEVGGDQPFMYLFVALCLTIMCIIFTFPYIAKYIVIGKKKEIVYSPEEIAKRDFRGKMQQAGVKHNEGTYSTRTINIQEEKQLALGVLREQLNTNNLTLEGTILETKFPKINDEELLSFVTTGKETTKPFMVQRITFGNKLNKAIKILFSGSVKHRKIKGEEDTYLVFDDSTVVDLEKRVQNLFMNQNIKIKLHNLD